MTLVNVGAERWDEFDMDAFLPLPTSQLTIAKPRRMIDLGRLARDSISSTTPIVPSSMNVDAVLEQYSSEIDLTFDDDGESSSSGEVFSDTGSLIHEWQTSALKSEVLDPTSIQLGFDFDCLVSLDEDVLHTPSSAFSQVCWSDAVSNPTEVLPKTLSSADPLSESPNDDVLSSVQDPPAADNLRIFQRICEMELEHSDICKDLDLWPRSDIDSKPPGAVYQLDEKTSFVIFDPPSFSLRDPNDSVAMSPVAPRPLAPSRHRQNIPRRMLTMCSKIPGRLSKR